MKSAFTLQMSDGLTIVSAKKNHIETICRLLGSNPNLRPRTEAEISSLLKYFLVALDKDGQVAGFVGSKSWGRYIEIISLRVTQGFRERQLGLRLTRTKLAQLLKTGRRVFALTTPDTANKIFFPLHFTVVQPQLLVPKIFGDCVKCDKNVVKNGVHQCNEIAVIYPRRGF